jgi:hypothetical protein
MESPVTPSALSAFGRRQVADRQRVAGDRDPANPAVDGSGKASPHWTAVSRLVNRRLISFCH